MPSPFPGMDPFIEGLLWDEFHLRFIAQLADALVPVVRPRYVVRVERRVYVEHTPEERRVRPDFMVLERRGQLAPTRSSPGVATAGAITPVLIRAPVPEELREPFLTIRERETMEVVTVAELLSPTNKRPGADGRREYLAKREAVFQSGTHLIELDLLRRGERLPMEDPLPPADYYAFVSRAPRWPLVDVYAWTLRQPLPAIPIPLAGDDPDVPLDLQTAFSLVYDRAGYDYSLDYRGPVEPPLGEGDAAWVGAVLGEWARELEALPPGGASVPGN